MLSERVVREAYDLCARGAMKVKTGSEEHITLVAMASLAGYILEENETFTRNTSTLLDYLRKRVGQSGEIE